MVDAVGVAFEQYYEWSGGFWLNYAPESYIQVEIVRALAKMCPYVTLEDSVRDILFYGEAKRGAMPRGSHGGRVDAIVWWKNEKPRLLIEVKRGWTYHSITADAKRLRQLKNRCPDSVQDGLIVVYTDARKGTTIDRRFRAMAKNSGTRIKKRLGSTAKTEEGQTWFWDVACFSVSE